MKHLIRKICLCFLCVALLGMGGGLVANATDGDGCVDGGMHTQIVTIPAVPATCGTPGKTAGVMCKTCGKVIQEGVEVPATGKHTNVGKINAVAATCTEPGSGEGVLCNDCGEVLDKPQVIPATGHTEEVIPGKAATCTEEGLTEGKKCSVCGEILVAQEVIPAGHTEEVIPGKAATCTEEGLTEGKKCSVCGEVLQAQQTIDRLPHTEQVVPTTAGDCLHPGLTEGKVCAVCGVTLVAQQSTGAGDHVMEDGKCTVCGYQKPTTSTAGLDKVPKTGDITGQVYMTLAAGLSMLAAAAYVVRRSLVK